MLLAGLPSVFVRSPDRTIWRFLRATNQNRKPSQMGGELVVACETGTLLIRSTRKIIQCPPQRFCRVPYVDLPLVRASASPRTKRGPRLSDSATSKKVPKGACERTKILCVCGMPNRPAKLAYD